MVGKHLHTFALVLLTACSGSHSSTGDARDDPSTDPVDPDPAPDPIPDPEYEVGPDYPNCNHNEECPPHEFCEFGAKCHAPGTCQSRGPDPCPDTTEPVCGCDMHNHRNDCGRRHAGVSLYHMGHCRGIMDCNEGDPDGRCTDGFCENREDLCGVTTMMGWCFPTPATCPDIDDPSCGCDGTLYDNDCLRMQAGVWRSHFGTDPPCEAP
jgi:hypothetical protein